MNNITLSYIITTRNKLPYLRETIKRLLDNAREDEEIIVTDGASSDGTRNFLEELYTQGKIHRFISEPDVGESHGLNKLFLIARGELIKNINDDDAMYYPGIQACKKFMQKHPEIDLLSTEGAKKNQSFKDPVRPLEYRNDYKRWLHKSTPFDFCGLGIMLRKQSIPLLGLWNPSFARADAEFSLRVTASRANIAWYTGTCFVNIANPQSTSHVQARRIRLETGKLERFYLNRKPESVLTTKSKIIMRKLIIKLLKSKSMLSSKENLEQGPSPKNWVETFELCNRWLNENNEKAAGQFLFRDY